MTLVGRAVSSKKLLVDEVSWLDMKHLTKMAIFEKGPNIRWTSRWQCGGRESGSVGYYLVEGHNGPVALRFMYTITGNYTGDKKDYDYKVSLESTSCYFGGQRWWFICPLRVRRNCVYRCRVIYLTYYNNYFGCRECCQLTYECRRKHRDFYYEHLHKPQARLEIARKNLRSRSPEKRALALLEIDLRRRQFKEFDRLSNARLMKLTGQAKWQ